MKMLPAPFKKIGSIWLPSGVMFDVWSNYGLGVAIEQLRQDKIARVCRSASPQLPAAYLNRVQRMFLDAGIFESDRVLHWVGYQTEIEHVCTCFGILERE